MFSLIIANPVNAAATIPSLNVYSWWKDEKTAVISVTMAAVPQRNSVRQKVNSERLITHRQR